MYPISEYSDESFKPYRKLNKQEDWINEYGDHIQVLISLKEIVSLGNVETMNIVFKGIQKGEKIESILLNSLDIDINSIEFETYIKDKMKDFYVEGNPI